jgi:hypothetical protein
VGTVSALRGQVERRLFSKASGVGRWGREFPVMSWMNVVTAGSANGSPWSCILGTPEALQPVARGAKRPRVLGKRSQLPRQGLQIPESSHTCRGADSKSTRHSQGACFARPGAIGCNASGVRGGNPELALGLPRALVGYGWGAFGAPLGARGLQAFWELETGSWELAVRRVGARGLQRGRRVRAPGLKIRPGGGRILVRIGPGPAKSWL